MLPQQTSRQTLHWEAWVFCRELIRIWRFTTAPTLIAMRRSRRRLGSAIPKKKMWLLMEEVLAPAQGRNSICDVMGISTWCILPSTVCNCQWSYTCYHVLLLDCVNYPIATCNQLRWSRLDFPWGLQRVRQPFPLFLMCFLVLCSLYMSLQPVQFWFQCVALAHYS